MTHQRYSFSFDDTYGIAPRFLAQIQSRLGRNPTNVRIADITGSGAVLWLAEEQSADTELSHLAEDVGYVVLDG